VDLEDLRKKKKKLSQNFFTLSISQSFPPFISIKIHLLVESRQELRRIGGGYMNEVKEKVRHWHLMDHLSLQDDTC